MTLDFIADVFDWVLLGICLLIMAVSIWVGDRLQVRILHMIAAGAIPITIFYLYKVLDIWSFDHDFVRVYDRVSQIWFGVILIWTLFRLENRRRTNEPPR